MNITGNPLNRVNGVLLPLAGDFAATLTLTGSGGARKPFTLGAITIAGALHDSTWNVAGNIGNVTVHGTVSGSAIRAKGKVQSFTAAAFVNSLLFAGFIPASAGDPLAGGIFTLGADIGAFTVTGSQGACANSFVAASALGHVQLRSVATANGGVRFGLLAHTVIRSVIVASPAFSYNPNASTPQSAVDFEIVIV
jgi:hypothetical protein